MKWIKVALATIIVILGSIHHNDGARILLVSTFPGKSHWLTFEHILGELLDRGHEITAITNYPLKNSTRHGDRYREVLIDPPFDFEADLPMESYYKTTAFSNPFFKLNILLWLGLATTEYAFESPNVGSFMKEEGLGYELVIAEQFAQEAFLMFGHKYRASIVTINTLGYTDYIDRSFGMITPLSFVPHFFTEFTDEMNFFERLYNVVLTVYDWAHRKFVFIPKQNALAQKYFASEVNEFGGLPSIEELELNVSVTLTNYHIISFRPRPKMIGMVDIAGVHIRPAKELPNNIKTFLDSSPPSGGAIYINFGTFLRSSAMPPETLQVFLEVFRRLPQYNFLWKWESDQAPDLPPNVLLQKWIPQNDVLAHPKIKLFLTHGGIFGAQESVYWGRPMLFVPFYGDQHGNALKFQQEGIGLTIKIANVTVAELHGKIEQIVKNESFQQNADRLSSLFRDNPTDPLQESVFWIEYVIRHRGAKHLKSAAVRMPWYRYLLLDLAAATAVAIYVSIWLTKHAIGKVCKKSDKNLSKKRQ
uniref:UDP-glucuronosyltransferase n=2 Tax=Culex pipiens TaxID=7175 RepID=A0A8D8CYC2_CULPI